MPKLPIPRKISDLIKHTGEVCAGHGWGERGCGSPWPEEVHEGWQGEDRGGVQLQKKPMPIH